MLFISYLLKRNLVHSIWFCSCWKIFFVLLWFLSPTFRFTIFDLFTDGAASARPTWNPLLHSNQHTQCHTKDSGFYLYFFICYRHSQQQERNRGELGGRRLQKNKDFVLLLISSLPPPSPSFAISFSFAFALLFSLQVFLFWPCAWEEREVTEKRERGRTNYFSTVLPSSLTVALLPTDKQRDKSIQLSAPGWGWQTAGGQTAHLLQEGRPCLHHSTQENSVIERCIHWTAYAYMLCVGMTRALLAPAR